MYSQIFEEGTGNIIISASFRIIGQMQRNTEVKTEHKNIHVVTDAYFLPQLPASIFDQCMALPYHLYVISTSGTDMEAQLPIAYGTALVLILIILLVNLLANALRKYFEKKIKTN